VRFQKWVYSNNVESKDVLPAKPFVVAIYLAASIFANTQPLSYLHAIKWFHGINGLQSPAE